MGVIAGEIGSSRGQSELIGVVLLFGLVISVSLAVVVIGSGAITATQSDTTMASAETTMLELQSSMQNVESVGGTVSFASITGARPASDAARGAGSDGGTGGQVRVNETAGEITVTVTDASEGTTETISQPLGAVVYEQEGQRVAYQGGGVFRQSTASEGSVMVSPPNVGYQYRNGVPTLSVPITQVTVPGSATTATPDDQLQLADAGGRVRHLPSSSMPNPLDSGDSVTLTIDSQYYEGWGAAFAQRTDAGIDYDRDDGEVTVTFDGARQPPGSVDSSAVFSTSAKITNQGRVDTYDSTIAGYGGWWDRENGDVKIDGVGRLDSNDDPQIHGDYTATGHGEFANGPDIYGETILGAVGEVTVVQNDADFHGPFSTTGSLSVETGAHTFGGDVIVGEDIVQFRDATVTGDVHVGGSMGSGADFYGTTVTGDLLLGGAYDPNIWDTGATVEGSLSAGGTVTVEAPLTVDGATISSGTRVVIEGGTHSVDVRSKGSVLVTSGATIQGDVEANGDVTINGRVEATAAGDGGDVRSGGDVTVGGTVTGAVDENVSPPPVDSLGYESITAPTTPTVPETESLNDLIDEKRQTLFVDDENDNDDHDATIDDIENANCGGGCTLPAGQYALEKIDIGNGDSLRLDAGPDGGTVELYVDDDIRITDTVEIAEDTTVHVYANEDFRMDHQDAVISIPNDDATQFWVYTRPDAEAEFVKATFTGVLYGPGTDTQSATAVTITNSVTIKGAVIAEPPAPISADVSIHYDEALNGVRPGPERALDASEVAFLRFTTRAVGVSG